MKNPKRAPSLAAPNYDGRWTPALARRILGEWDASGQSLAAFAARRGLVAQRLSWWRKRLGAETRVGVPVAPAPLVPVTVVSALPDAPAARVQLGAVHVELRTLDACSARFITALARALGCAP